MIDDRLLQSLEYNLGQEVMSALRNPDVVEIILNSDGKLWEEKLGDKMRVVGGMDAAQGRLVISLVASALDTAVTLENPIVEGELPLDGSRFEGVNFGKYRHSARSGDFKAITKFFESFPVFGKVNCIGTCSKNLDSLFAQKFR